MTWVTFWEVAGGVVLGEGVKVLAALSWIS